MKQNKLAIFIIIFSMMMAITSVTNAQDRIERIGDKIYQQLNDQWFYLTEQADTVRFSPDKLIVKLKDNATDIAQFKQGLQLNDLEIVSGPTSGGYYVLRSPSVNSGIELKQTFNNHDDIQSVMFSEHGEWLGIPNDEKWLDQWNLPKVKLPYSWQITKGNPDIVVAIIDSGTKLDHEDIEDCLWSGIGYNALNPGTSPTDSNGHGTSVTGITGARTNNAIGIAGVAGCWDSNSGVRLMILKVGDSFPVVGATSQAIEWAADNGADVINLSLSHNNVSILESAVNYAIGQGVTIVAAAGNNGGNGSSDKSIRYPAKYSNTIAVGGTIQDDTRWVTSGNFGSAIGPELDLMAPGGATIIMTTLLNGGYGLFNGTSASAPHVAGVAGLMKSVNPSLTPAQVRTILQNTADWKSHMNSNEYGHGRLNTYEAIKHALPLQFEDHTFTSSQTLTEKAHIFGNVTLSSGVTLTIPEGKVAVIDGSLSRSGSSNATLVVEGRLIIDPGSELNGIRVQVEDTGDLIVRPNVTMDNNIAAMTINGTATIGEGFSMKRGGLVVNEDATLNMYGADIEVHKGGTDGLVGYGPGSVILRGEAFISGAHFHLEDGSGTWGGVNITGPDAAGSSLANVLVEHAGFGISLNNGHVIAARNLC